MTQILCESGGHGVLTVMEYSPYCSKGSPSVWVCSYLLLAFLLLECGVSTQEKRKSENLAELTEVHGAFATLDVH